MIRSCIVDFFGHAARLVIEPDGDQRGTPEKLACDEARTAVLNDLGLLVPRFTNAVIDNRLDAVCACINQAVQDRLPPERAASLQPPETEIDDAALFSQNQSILSPANTDRRSRG